MSMYPEVVDQDEQHVRALLLLRSGRGRRLGGDSSSGGSLPFVTGALLRYPAPARSNATKERDQGKRRRPLRGADAQTGGQWWERLHDCGAVVLWRSRCDGRDERRKGGLGRPGRTSSTIFFARTRSRESVPEARSGRSTARSASACLAGRCGSRAGRGAARPPA